MGCLYLMFGGWLIVLYLQILLFLVFMVLWYVVIVYALYVVCFSRVVVVFARDFGCCLLCFDFLWVLGLLYLGLVGFLVLGWMLLWVFDCHGVC